MADSNETNHPSVPGDRITFEYVRPGNRRSTFDAALLRADDEVVIMSHRAEPSKPLRHAGDIVIDRGYTVVWFLFKGHAFDVGRFYRPEGSWTGFYVDILEPVYWDGVNPHSMTPLVDLSLDLWIAPDGTHQILDEDEFQHSVMEGTLTANQASAAQSELQRLVAEVQNGSFPPLAVTEYVADFR